MTFLKTLFGRTPSPLASYTNNKNSLYFEDERTAKSAPIVQKSYPLPVSATVNPVKPKIKTITVVYSTDSLVSLTAARAVKEILQLMNNSESPDVKFIEVGMFNDTQFTDAYMWLDIAPLTKAINPKRAKEFSSKKHLEISDNALGMKNMYGLYKSYFPQVNNYPEVTVVRGIGMDVSSINQDALHYGAVIEAVAGILSLTEGYKPSTHHGDLTWKHSQMQRDCLAFYHKKTDIGDLARIYKETYNFLVSMVSSSAVDPITEVDTPEDKALTKLYIRRIRAVGAVVSQQATVQEVVLTDHAYINRGPLKAFKKVNVQVLTTLMSQDFWLARRLIGFSYQLFRNGRLAFHGNQYFSNLPASGKAVLMASQDD